MFPKEVDFSNPECSRLVEGILNTFIHRRDLYARQLEDGRYVCILKPLTPAHILAHLRGFLTLGAYILDPDNQARFVVFDADEDAQLQILRTMAASLAQDGATTYLEASRRGGHMWLFLPRPMSGKDARAFGQGLQVMFGLDGIEMFPKQDQLKGGPGSLIRLPFGIHRRTGLRYGFITPDLQPLSSSLPEEIGLLSAPHVFPQPLVDRFRAVKPAQPVRQIHPLQSIESSGGTLSERIKSSVSVYDFIGHYVQLTPLGRGLCPFHDDRMHSFAVNQEGNYWHCFAGCGGGSIIDFWMKWQKCDFITAVRELARLLL